MMALIKSSQRRSWVLAFAAIAGLLPPSVICAQEDNDSVGGLVEHYRRSSRPEERRGFLKKLLKAKPKTTGDVAPLQAIFKADKWDEDLFHASMGALEKIDNPSLDVKLIEVLQDEKSCVARVSQGDLCGKSEREMRFRERNVNVIIGKLEELKSARAVPILKEYLTIRNTQLAASQALAAIGDKSASEEMRDRAYRGESVKYGGLGLNEARKVVRDLENQNNRGKWEKIGTQLLWVQNPEAKPDLRRLFSHESSFVRLHAAETFTRLSDDSDSPAILDMAKNADWAVRSNAISAMKKGHAKEYEEMLIALLGNDPDYVVRLNAADALGQKRISRAVPSLERALNDKERKVRDHAFIALYILTGKKYEYQGRRSLIEREAEMQKEGPTSH